jgi:hypothetical protein
MPKADCGYIEDVVRKGHVEASSLDQPYPSPKAAFAISWIDLTGASPGEIQSGDIEPKDAAFAVINGEIRRSRWLHRERRFD